MAFVIKRFFRLFFAAREGKRSSGYRHRPTNRWTRAGERFCNFLGAGRVDLVDRQQSRLIPTYESPVRPLPTFEKARGLDPVQRLKARENVAGSENPTK